MKIAILTLQHSNNYGAMFQAYALSKFLRSAGHEVFFINYYQDVPTIARYLRRPLSLLGKIFGKGAFSLKFFRAKRVEARGKSVEQGFVELFDQFRIDHLGINGAPVHYSDLEADCPDADAFIVGSDQVWAADFVFSSPAYLLAFTPSSARKISYAASFGKAKLERYLQKTFYRQVSSFHAVSLRERSGVDIVEKLVRNEASHVVDPTLLVSDYSEIIDYSLVPERDYVLSYRLSQDQEMSDWTNESIHAIARKFQLPSFSVSTNVPEGSGDHIGHLQPTPGQLLGLIERARFFVTNSFHGTVFAINFRTNFLTLARDSAKDKQNLRLQELLDSVDASERFCDPLLKTDKVLSKLALSQDFDAMHRLLQPRRIKSIDFLNDALQ